MKNSKTIFIGSAFLSFSIFLTVVLCANTNGVLENKAEAVTHDASCSWSHYNVTESSVDLNGTKEYWACCKHRGSYVYSRDQVTGTHIDEIGDLPYEKRVEVTKDDPRYLSPNLSEKYDLLYDTKSLNWDASHVSPTGYGGGATITGNCQDDEFLSSYTKCENINQTQNWIWFEPQSTDDITSYEEICFWVWSNQSKNLGIVNDYKQKTVYSISANQWTKISVKPSDVAASLLRDIGFGVWGNISNLTLKFSSVYGSKRASLYSAKTDYWVGLTSTYGGGFTPSVNNMSKAMNPYSENLNMNNTNEFIWLHPNNDADITTYSKIYFWVWCNQNRNTGLINNYAIVQSFPVYANKWRYVELDVKTLKDTYGITKLSDIGFGDHGTHTNYTLRFTSVYGCSAIDDVLTGKETFDIAAYSIPYLGTDTSRADTTFAYLKDAGFTSGFGLLDGRSGDTPIQQILADYLVNPNTTTLNALKTQISQGMGSNVAQYRNAIRAGANNGVKYEALIGSLYDLYGWFNNESSPLYGKTMTNEQFLTYVREFLYSLDYYGIDEEEYYKGLAIYDEPKYDDVDTLQKLKSIIGIYKTEIGMKGNVKVNLLPAQDYNSTVKPYGSVFTQYIQNYMDILFPSLGYIGFDIYPKVNGSILSYHLSNLEQLAWTLKQAGGGTLKTYLYSANQVYYGSIDKTRNANDLLFQMNASMAFGAKEFEYFQFAANEDTQDSTNCIVNKHTLEKTPVFNYAKAANAEISAIGRSFCNFTWDGVMTNRSCTQFNALQHKLSSHGNIKSISSGSLSVPLLVGCFHKDDFNGYVMMNYTSVDSPKSTNMTLNFKSKYNKIAVFKDGALTIQDLYDDSFTTSLESSKAAFVIPFN